MFDFTISLSLMCFRMNRSHKTLSHRFKLNELSLVEIPCKRSRLLRFNVRTIGAIFKRKSFYRCMSESFEEKAQKLNVRLAFKTKGSCSDVQIRGQVFYSSPEFHRDPQ